MLDKFYLDSRRVNSVVNCALICRLWLFPAAVAQRQQQQQQILCFEDFLPSKDAVIQDLVVDVNKKLGQRHINGASTVQNELCSTSAVPL